MKPRPKQLDSPWVPRIMRVASRAHVWAYRGSRGLIGGRWRIGSAFPRGVPVCLLTVRGRKSGLPRTTPLLYLPDGDAVVVVASQGGLPRDPQWYRNVEADPDVVVQVRGDVRQMRARTAEGSERAQLWTRLVRHYSDFDAYQSWTERAIPVVVCEPRADAPV